MEISYTFIAVTIGIILDSLIGDPYKLPHPIRLFGNSIAFFEKRFNNGSSRVIKGALVWATLILITFASFWAINWALASYLVWQAVFIAIFFFYGISNRTLIVEGLKVERALNRGDLVLARENLSMIVGRDTKNLSASKIRSAVIETLSENLSDGVVAPLFYFAIGGIPAMMSYKMINTLDSMVGYKNERYKDFGCFSAKADDVANFIPARLTAFLMALLSLSFRSLRFIFKYGRSHSSPNSGYPESALAGILDCRLGGPSEYFGKVVEKPYIGSSDREISHSDVIRTCFVNGKVAAVCYVVVLCGVYYLGFLFV